MSGDRIKAMASQMVRARNHGGSPAAAEMLELVMHARDARIASEIADEVCAALAASGAAEQARAKEWLELGRVPYQHKGEYWAVWNNEVPPGLNNLRITCHHGTALRGGYRWATQADLDKLDADRESLAAFNDKSAASYKAMLNGR